jgi:hypothetical protein
MLWTRALMIVVVAVVGFVVIGGVGCGHRSCDSGVLGDQPATFQLSCGTTNLTNVALSGVCATGDAGPSDVLVDSIRASISIGSPSPGECHVVVTFATGFTYSADVTFTMQRDPDPNCCGACSYVAPDQPTFMVNNPSSTCVDSRIDGGADAFPDAASATGVDG